MPCFIERWPSKWTIFPFIICLWVCVCWVTRRLPATCAILLIAGQANGSSGEMLLDVIHSKAHYGEKIILQKCKKVPASNIRCFIYCVQLSSMLIKTLKRRNTILNRFENYISLSHPVLTFDHMARHNVSARRLQLGWKSGGSLSGEREVYRCGAQHNKSTSQTMLFISQRAFLCPFLRARKSTHTRAHPRSQISGGK